MQTIQAIDTCKKSAKLQAEIDKLNWQLSNGDFARYEIDQLRYELAIAEIELVELKGIVS